jgi:chemotaxis response regulator CheB
LVVDDSVTMRAILGEVFTKERQMTVVGIASDADEAVRMLREFYPDVVTIDIAMPGMDGMALLDHVVAHSNARPVMLSSHVESMAEAMAHGALGFFDKAKVLREPKKLLKLITAAAAGRTTAGGGPPECGNPTEAAEQPQVAAAS